MVIKNLKNCEKFTAGDNSILRELLHPLKADLKIQYSLAHAVVKKGQTTRPHRLKTSEVYYILEGRGLMRSDEEQTLVYPGQAVYIPPYSIQHIENKGNSDLKFLCIVSPAWRAEDEEIINGENSC